MEMLESFIDSSSVEQVQQRVELYKKGCVTIKEVADSARTAAGSLKGLIGNRQREATRKRKSEAKADEHNVTKKLKSEKLQTPSLFLIDWAKVMSADDEVLCTKIALVEGASKMRKLSAEIPTLLSGSTPMSKCLEDAKVASCCKSRTRLVEV